MSPSQLSRRTFLIAGAGATAIAWLSLSRPAPASAAPAAPALLAERQHRTLLGVL